MPCYHCAGWWWWWWCVLIFPTYKQSHILNCELFCITYCSMCIVCRRYCTPYCRHIKQFGRFSIHYLSLLFCLVMFSVILSFLIFRHRHLRGGRSSHQARMCENEAPTAAHREQDLQNDARRRYVFPHTVSSSLWSPSGFSINTQL